MIACKVVVRTTNLFSLRIKSLSNRIPGISLFRYITTDPHELLGASHRPIGRFHDLYTAAPSIIGKLGTVAIGVIYCSQFTPRVPLIRLAVAIIYEITIWIVKRSSSRTRRNNDVPLVRNRVSVYVCRNNRNGCRPWGNGSLPDKIVITVNSCRISINGYATKFIQFTRNLKLTSSRYPGNLVKIANSCSIDAQTVLDGGAISRRIIAILVLGKYVLRRICFRCPY